VDQVWLANAVGSYTLGANLESLYSFADLGGTLVGNDQSNIIEGSNHDDVIVGGLGDDALDGGPGINTLDYSGNTGSGVTLALAAVSMTPGTATATGGAGTDTVRNFTHVIGSAFANTLTGNGAGNQLDGGAGDDMLSGLGGRDTLNGRAGDDTLDGGDGDTVEAGAGNDFLYYGGAFTVADRNDGGAGTDTIGLLGTYNLTFAAESLVGIERLALYTGQPSSGGTAHSYTLQTLDSNVGPQGLQITAASLQAGETLSFDGSAETDGAFTITGGGGSDSIAGGALADVLRGGGGADNLFGLGGDDRLIGGAGADTLRGGAGRDLFIYQSTGDSTTAATDRISDFQKGVDRIDLRAIDAIAGGENDAFTFIGGAGFGNKAGELRVCQQAGSWFAAGDVDGDCAADLVIRIDTPTPQLLTGSDFVL
jgi:Ca2+-binding RTX toxin-like protein